MPSPAFSALVACCALGVVAPSTHAQGGRSALFDAEVHTSGGLHVEFTRPIATRDDAGLELAPHEARFGAGVAIAGAAAAFTTIHTAQNRSRLAVGPSADYSGWILCAYSTTAARVEVSIIDENTGALTGTINTRQALYPFTHGVRTRRPSAVSVAPGLIVLLCQTEISGVVKGVSFVGSTDRGASWTVLAEFEDEPQPGVSRVKEWSMRQWYTLERSEGVPNEIWIPAVDYRWASGPASGWSGFLLRATRANPGERWEVAVAKIRQHDRVGFTGGAFHAHSMGLVSDGEGGMIVLVPVGDTIDDNAIIKGSLPPGANWADPDAWSWDDAWHGALGDPNAGATEGLQGVGMSVGPEEGTLLIGSDTQADAIYLVDARAPKGEPKVVYKPQMSDATGQECFSIVNPHPHAPQTVGWFAATRPKLGVGGEGGAAGAYSRVVFSPDARAWTEVMSAAAGSALHATTVAASQNNLYVASHMGAPGNMGVSSRATPRARTMRGLLLNDGGEQRILDWYWPFRGTGVTLTEVTHDLASLGVPKQPSYGKVFRAERPAGAGTVILYGLASSDLPPGPVSGRVWMYNLAPTGNFVGFADTGEGGAGALNPTLGGGATYLSAGQWHAVDLMGVRSAPGPVSLRVQTATQSPLDMLICVDSLSTSHSPPGYALAGHGAVGAPETLTASRFDASHAVTVYHAFRSQSHGVDTRWHMPVRFPLLSAYADRDNYILVEAEISHTPVLRMTVVEGGKQIGSPAEHTARWARDEQTLLALAFDRDAGAVEITFSHAGSTLTTMGVSKGAPFTTLLPQELRLAWFEGMPTFPSVQCALRVLDGVAHPQSQREATLSGVDWIPAAQTACSIDTNGDGVINFADLNAVLTDFGRAGEGLPGDVNCDGAVNFADLNVILSAFGSAP
ncbi:MAG: hypothetical protein KF684_11620 [Phycisphaeraceae bacterium]|nr:hypothetical protein [Phycisphaeraceae bacterium]